MKIVVDAFGGDNAPVEIVKGAITAVNILEDVEVILSGKENEIQNVLDEYGYKGNKIEIINAETVITNDESPTTAIRAKKDSSLVVGLNRLKTDDEVVGFVSAGSTGAVLAGGTFIVGRIPGVLRPALAPCLPTVNDRKTMLIDCGANVDSKAEFLQQFAIMGSAYMKAMLNIEDPKVGLLNIGAEDKKGNALTHEAFELLKQTPNINFVGNVEAREILSGDVDVIVSDGFAGNVALKATEGAVLNVFSLIKKSIKDAGLFAKLGAGLLKPVFKELKNKLNQNTIGGSPFFGVNKIVVKCHGNSDAETVFSTIKQVKEIHESNFIEKLKEGLKVLN